MTRQKELGQYMTPGWAALALVERFYPNLSSRDMVIEPSCGTGAFLAAIPEGVPAVGIEIDAELAEAARRNSGRHVIVGDFRLVDLPFRPTLITGNPPFASRTVSEFLDRSHVLLEEEGEVGLILPCYYFQAASTVETLAERWSIAQHMLPKNLYPRLQYPLCFAQLTKGRTRGLVGFALYHELAAVNRLRDRYRAILAGGEGSVWKAVVRAALEAAGGRATLSRLYAEIDGNQPTGNQFWREKVRQVVQTIGIRIGEGEWALPEDLPAAA